MRTGDAVAHGDDCVSVFYEKSMHRLAEGSLDLLATPLHLDDLPDSPGYLCAVGISESM